MRYALVAGVAAAQLLLIACGGGGGGGGGGPSVPTDTTAPSVVSTNPASGASGVAVNSAITATFSESMDPSTISGSTVSLSGPSGAVSGNVSYNGTTATFTPLSPLAYSTSYTALITTGATDAAGNALVAAHAWSFTTGIEPDTTAPSVVSTNPASGGSDAAIDGVITIVFSEPMDPATIDLPTITVNGPSGNIPGNVTYTGTTATFDPAILLALNTSYTVTVTTDARDLAGNPLLAETTWSFTTEVGTAVNGILSTDVTWTLAGSPYRLTGNVQVAYGTTLTIEPGVRVFGENCSLLGGGGMTCNQPHALQTYGNLLAVGSAGSKISFFQVRLLPGNNTLAEPFTITIQHADVTGGSIYPATGNAIYGSLTLRDSVFRDPYDAYTQYFYLWYPVADCFIERNIFVRAGGIITITSNAVTVYVRNNVIYQQPPTATGTPFAVMNQARYDTSDTVVENNSFLSTDRVALALPVGYSSTGMNAVNNYWGTTDTSIIDQMIFDRNDDLGSAGYVTYSPILTSPHPDTPDPTPYIQ